MLPDCRLILAGQFPADRFRSCCRTRNRAPTPESGWASQYEFLPASGTLRLHYANDGGAFVYRFTGEFLDRKAWVERQLGSGNFVMVKRVMDEVRTRPEPVLAQQLLASVDTGLS